MITVSLILAGAEADLRPLAQILGHRLYLPYWETYAVGHGDVTANIGEWDCDEGDTVLSAVDSFADRCSTDGLSFRADDISADLKIVLLVDNDTMAPKLAFWPDTLAKLTQLGLGLVLVADIGAGYSDNESVAGPAITDDTEEDRSDDIENFIATMTAISRSAVGRTGSHTFVLVKSATPSKPFSTLNKREISSRLAQLYAPPFYSSPGAAKAAASQHARAVWALSRGLGDMTASNIAQYLASL